MRVPIRALPVLALLLGLVAPVAAQAEATSSATPVARAAAVTNVAPQYVTVQPLAATKASTSATKWAKKSTVTTRKSASSKSAKVRSVRIGYKFTVDVTASSSKWWKVKGRTEWVAKADVTATRSSLWPSKTYARLQAWRHIDAASGWNVKTQYPCFKRLMDKESGWNRHAQNPSSGAYGIPQALPGKKMASVSADWRHNPDTQVKWGLKYIKSRYKSPCKAWSHFQNRGWY